MANFPGQIYAPPGVYTKTLFDNPLAGALSNVKIPVVIGTGNEILFQEDLEVVRGSSSTVDQQVPQEDMDGRAVVQITSTGQIVLGNFDGVLNRVQVRNFPIVRGDGTGTTTNERNAVSVTINGEPTVVLTLDGARGIVTLAQEPQDGDIVRITYYFNRTDTLVTDNLSDQITSEAGVLRGEISLDVAGGETYDIVTGVNNVLSLTVDRESATNITLPAGSFTPAQVVSFINGQPTGTLVASSYVDNNGRTAIALTAQYDILMGDGTANALLGFTTGASTSRNRVFYTFQGPIVTGNNGGVTTTSVTDLTVSVDNTPVVPTAVDGGNRAVTLPFAPKAGSVVKITYYFNTWQNTFDYLANIAVTDVLRMGITPGRNDYIEGVDFVLKDDLIVWGTASIISSGETTSGYTAFGSNQVSTTLVDNKAYLEVCEPVVNTSVVPAVDSRKTFRLPFVPTTGNGRNTLLGQSLYSSISNNRIDLPTNRPDLVTAYWGFSLQDALDRGPVTVVKVDSATAEITLKSPVEPGASVWASFYYNILADNVYTLTTVVPGSAGIGTYSVTDKDGNNLFNTNFGTKSAGLLGITVAFPSGSETLPDSHFEGDVQGSTVFQGPVEEVATVTFATTQDTPAKHVITGSSPYYPILGASDQARIVIDGYDLATGAAGLDVSYPTGLGVGFFASLIGDEVVYDASTGGLTYTLDATNNEVSLSVDGILVSAAASTGSAKTLADFVTALNAAALTEAPSYTGITKFTSPFAVTATEYDQLVLHYTGKTTTGSGNQTITLTPGSYNSVTALVADINTQLASINGVAGLNGTVTCVANAAGQLVFSLELFPYTTATGSVLVGSVIPTDTLTIGGVLLTAVSGAIAANQFDVSSGVPATIAANIADAINLVGNGLTGIVEAEAVGTTVNLTAVAAGAAGNAVTVVASGGTMTPSGGTLTGGVTGDDAGFLEFITGAAGRDFAVLAGIDTAAATAGTQTKLYQGPIARRYTVGSGALNHDRLIFRNRLLPGSGSLSPQHAVAQSGLTIQGSSGTLETGLAIGQTGEAGFTATVRPASLAGHIGFVGGQATGYGDDRDSMPAVVFYDGTGTTAQNNVFKFTLDGVPVTVVFAASASGTATPLGTGAFTGDLLKQIGDAMATAGFGSTAAAVISAGLLRLEGAGLRLTSNRMDQFSSLEIGSGSANSVLGFLDGQSDQRDAVSVQKLSAALMSQHCSAGAFVTTYMLNFATPASNYFAAEALALVATDTLGGEYLMIQSQMVGVGSSVIWSTSFSADILAIGTGLLITSGSGAVGEAGIAGFYVLSSDPADGSGTANTSVFNSGTGQDGVVGQTYRDDVTGLTFTILEREGGFSYPAGESFTFRVGRTFTTNANIPTKAIGGVEMLVTNTAGVGEGDTATVATYERGGSEPAVGDLYNVTYAYRKQDFSTQLYTRLNSIETNYGSRNPNNPVSLASYLLLINGGVVVAIKQVAKDEGSEFASVSKYVTALDELIKPLSGGLRPDVLVPLEGSSLEYFRLLGIHCDIQSSIRYRQERTAILGLTPSVTPTRAGSIAQSLTNARLRMVYPDSALLSLTNELNQTEQYLVEGFYLAAALAGSVTSPNLDVATPWTNRVLFGFDGLGRILDIVEMNEVAVQGVTVIEEKSPNLKVRHGLTTNVSNVLTRTPTIQLIADEVQQRSRAVLDRFIGVKYLPGILTEIEGTLAAMLSDLVRQQILAAFTGVRANVTADPTMAEVEAFYQPIFPLLYLILTFNLRSQLDA